MIRCTWSHLKQREEKKDSRRNNGANLIVNYEMQCKLIFPL